jgi:tRNA-specific 2-thiouridylase
VDRNGNVLAPHDGIERFTVGQRKGLGFGGPARRYVLEIVPESRTVVVGDRDELLAAGLVASRVNWLAGMPDEPVACHARIRYRHGGAAATVTALPEGGAEVRFAEPQMAVSPGQAAVFYDGDRVLGGGWIEKALPA